VSTATRPRVLVLAHDVHDSGGMERGFRELILRGSRHVDFTVVSSTLSPDLVPLVTWHRVAVPPRPFPLKFATFFAWATLAGRRLKADLVHTCGAIAAVRADVVTIQFCHAGFAAKTGRIAPSTAPLARRLNTRIARTLALWAERLCYRPSMSRRMACVSPGVRDEVLTFYPGVETRLAPNGVDLDRFQPSETARESARSRERVSPCDVVALFVGGDWDRKGLAIAIEGVAFVNRRTDARAVLWVVGKGDQERFAKLARDVGVGEEVRFFGPRSDTEAYYQAADVLVFPTLYEAFPLVALEAAACGLPVIATRANGVVDLVERGGGGMLVERTPAAVADALQELVTYPGRARAHGAAGAAWVRQFTWERSVESFLSIYDELLRTSNDVELSAR
jgi:glycosyltransferase involved in cell wall biosynthesis